MEPPARQPRVPAGLGTFIGNGRVVNLLRRAVGQDRLPHAMIFAGPDGVGKCTLAFLLAQRLNCLSPAGGDACGECLACRKTLASLQSRYLVCLSPRGEVPCGACASCRVLSNQHPDVRLVEPEKTTIGINQVRDLIAEISYQPFEGRYRVVVLDPADLMRQEAHNSLLKTLEEPPSNTFIILVTARPFELLGTIRSRARTLQFTGIPQHQIADYLVRVAGRTPDEARMSAALSSGSLASALVFDGELYRELREKAMRFVSLLLRRGSFTHASAIAALVTKDKKDRESFDIWLECVEALLQDVYFAHIAPARMAQNDLLDELKKLADCSSRGKAAGAIEAVKDLRRSLRHNIQRQLAVEALFLSLTEAPDSKDKSV